jgi:hypothetical protein
MASETASTKSMRLRYAGHCRICDRELEKGVLAIYERQTRSVLCLTCDADRQSAIDPGAATNPGVQAVISDTAAPEVFAGLAGASAQREYERRRDARETRIRGAHPKIGGLILALSDEPQSTKAWATGAAGEERLGTRLDGLTGDGIHVLHDRRIPRTQANIDHIVVCASGVLVIDAKKYRGRPSLRVEGGILRPRVEKLLVGTRDCTKLVDGVHKQVNHVRTALESIGLDQIPVAGMLCFVDADWPLVGGDFTISSIQVLWPKKAAGLITKAGAVDESTAKQVFGALASAFPAYL